MNYQLVKHTPFFKCSERRPCLHIPIRLKNKNNIFQPLGLQKTLILLLHKKNTGCTVRLLNCKLPALVFLRISPPNEFHDQ